MANTLKLYRYLLITVLILVLSFNLLLTSLANAEPQEDDLTTIGNITDFSADGNTYTISAGEAKVRVIFYKDDMFRIWMTPDGEFTDPASDDIIVKTDFPDPDTEWSDAREYYRIDTADVVLRVYKQPLTFALYESDNQTLVWKETRGLSWDQNGTVQTLDRGEDEQFFGGGMQNGRFSHRDETIQIAVSYNWNDGGNPNAVPFYMSSAGYGVYRNTFAPGSYSFTDPVVTTHHEERFDAFYFHGSGLKDILDGYTKLTGRPFMPPIYGLELGDADCYNKDGQTTPDVLKVADGYKEHDLPIGWMLVNDGYGCGYVELEYVGDELRKRNIQLGLWTEDGLPNQEWEVGEAGVRVRKLDVAWVGRGYKFALDAAKEAYTGIEDNSDARGFVWMVEGWSGAQRYAVQWTGDQYGTWENIRFHIPTLMGSGLSGQAFTAGDIDGIFGGSPETYVRDLQWKVFNPVLMSMSGWAPTDKQPWRYGDPYTSINRKYLKLRERLMPYIYTYAAEAHRTGLPLNRAMVLEYPDDPVTWDTTTQYQYLFGESFLVAPVYEDTDVRHGIYLPKGTWIDYWNGKVYKGPTMINDYEAPLDTLPLFVKAGANIPMWPEMNSHQEKPKDPFTFDIYPKGTSRFTLYEDDGVTREYKQGAFSEQEITTTAPEDGSGDIVITVGPSVGDYDGKLDRRQYSFTVHTPEKPDSITTREGKAYQEHPSKEALDAATEGWYYDAEDRGGIVHIKTESMSTDEAFEITLHNTSAIDNLPPGEIAPAALVRIDAPEELKPGVASEATVTFLNGDDEALEDVHLSLVLPEEWEVNETSDATFNQVDAGEKVAATFEVTVPEGTSEGVYNMSARAEFKQQGRDYTTAEYGTTYVIDPYKIPQSQMTATATSEETGTDPAKHAIDGNPDTMWHTDWYLNDPLPQSITLNLGDTYFIEEVSYLPRQSGTNGNITQYKLYTSTDGENFTEVANGHWDNNSSEKIVQFPKTEASHVKLEAIQGVGGFASAAELNVFRAPPAESSAEIKVLIERFEEDGEFESESVARALKIHLTAVDRYEREEKAEKVVKHMKSFGQLLDHQKENDSISERAYNVLKAEAEYLIEKWQR